MSDYLKEYYENALKELLRFAEENKKLKEALDTLKSKVHEDNGNCTTIIIRNDIWEKISAL